MEYNDNRLDTEVKYFNAPENTGIENTWIFVFVF